ncbi:MAG: DUF4129 domain-containing protein [Thiofilum sp.]|uniref:DUF4129 domain-containing protein n=1 Tax=Thiofilum sp. TaxID=2212733 RepID=UPI0025CD9786|nr:DUF4129 domain-containing protein [Thiofilum sp.]MBK8454666.1 hypothetical protein [Thiofilum sp.]
MTPKLTIALRERTPFEALDLGLRLTQTAKLLWLGWVLFSVLVGLLFWALLPSEQLWLGLIVLWWLKPLYDRFLLHGLSKQVSEQPLTLIQWFNALPKLLISSNLLAALTWKRFSLVRSYVQSLWQLEGLTGKAARKRRTLLTNQFNRHAVLLTLSLFLAQIAIFLSCYGLLLLFDPTEATTEHIRNVFAGYVDREEEYWHHLLDYSFWLVAIILIEPFYVAAGFTLYLNRRVQLEAWDIEQALRAMAQRLSQKAHHLALGVLCTFTLFIITLPTPNYAAESPAEPLAEEHLPANQAKQQITTILDEHELQTRTVYRWVAKEKDKEKGKNSSNAKLSDQIITSLAQLLEGSLWLFIAIGLILAFIYREALLKLLRPYQAKKTTPPPPATLFGLDLSAESLPKDIPAAAQAAWQQGHYREALSLLYRSALHQLTHQQQLQIQAHHTEGDVLVLAQPHSSKPQLEYLTLLTRYWQQTAYGHINPAPEVLTQLLNAHQQAEAV